MNKLLLRSLLALACTLPLLPAAHADEAAIRKNLPQRIPTLPPIDEVIKSPIPGVYEVRLGTELLYVDENGDYILQGSLVDAKTRTNLTEAKINKLTAVDFAKLPFKDAFTWKNGNGSRKLAVFADPNCGYCKHFEEGLQKLKDVTVYVFLTPVLGGDSPQKSENIWCAKDPAKAWLGWMLQGKEPVRNMGACATPLERNVAFARKHRINGTPATFLVDGTRIPGAIPPEQLEKALIAASKPGAAQKTGDAN
jgi:thiol:disulfide interchange protein DsbC